MKALLVSASDAGLGGGQVQTGRLIAGLRAVGVDATMLCRNPTREGSLALPRVGRTEKLLGAVGRRLGLNDLHSISSFDVPRLEAFQAADVIDFHGIHHGVFSYLALPRISDDKPAVLSLHDMWPFTGHCHNSLDCGRWRHGCGRCPYPDVEPAVRRDSTRWDWKLKRLVYGRSKLVVVAPSRWLTSLAQESMLSRFPIHHVPHGIDTEMYRPLDRAQCRVALDLPLSGKVLLFVTESFSRRLKGGDLLVRALKSLPPSLRAEVTLLLVGRNAEAVTRQVDLPCVSLGFVTSDRLKVLAYSAADLFIHPTRADNFPVTVLESLACGLPVVSFRIGGVPDMVRPGVTGWLSEPEDADGLRNGIGHLLSDPVGLRQMAERCRETAVAEYALQRQVERYVEVYEHAISLRKAA
jgi:glycosyltransferase involved in cell wall biosynthesis